jgi:hypothetical protein
MKRTISLMNCSGHGLPPIAAPHKRWARFHPGKIMATVFRGVQDVARQTCPDTARLTPATHKFLHHTCTLVFGRLLGGSSSSSLCRRLDHQELSSPSTLEQLLLQILTILQGRRSTSAQVFLPRNAILCLLDERHLRDTRPSLYNLAAVWTRGVNLRWQSLEAQRKLWL